MFLDFLSGDWVKATRSVPARAALTQAQRPTLSQGAGFKPSPSSHMAANGFPNGEREGGLKKSPQGTFLSRRRSPDGFLRPKVSQKGDRGLKRKFGGFKK